ncbi:hypothetical protein AB0N09_42070 [Streptomyces erythrochromogenes]|uniref:hypothetical protein n=1 Tax=Streptomyces erythrochromogenes TaxID=285574 RepID=UPI00344AF317
MFVHEPVSGPWLRAMARQAARTLTMSVHLEWPSGIVTLHSSCVGDVFFHPAPADTPAPSAPDSPRRPPRCRCAR